MSCKNCGPPFYPGKLIKATKSLKSCAVCGERLSPKIAEAKFEGLRKNCPWFTQNIGFEPMCRPITRLKGYQRRCSKKNCAPLYWIKNMRQEEL